MNAVHERDEVAARPSCKLPERIFAADKQIFTDRFNRLPFQYRHNLTDHPLFDLPRLAELAECIQKTDPKKVNYFAGNARVDQSWNLEPGKAGTVSEAISRIHESGSWVLIKSVQEDPGFRAMMDQIIDELEELTGRHLRREITWPDAYIFIASPGSITPFHIDHEVTSLFQIHGAKKACLFDPADRLVTTEEEIERYYVGHLGAASYTEEKQARAFVYDQQPGFGVHHPSLAGHWVQTGDEYSVTLNINLCLRSVDRLGKVYQANHYLRGLGLKPAPPGQSTVRDRAKSLVMEMIGLQPKPRNKFQLIRRGAIRLETAGRLLRKLRRAPGKPTSSASPMT